ncbi:NIPSNAP family protein [Rhizobium leguminosarum bv. trifolii]|uniref:NIPSNAP family protein n=1 Tax=Rhizobium leguminosarum bv. trifolii TaxID=386 RepID=A0A3E1B9G2_RHILT|nr:NIPSNAP family protein [Rhizobium leguminosarum]RFB87966.1 NIPSNAP family protein [Rhizobium leguminosarum bv. trifolii]RFB88170.1 NIPSNAP family protein [Rhizobium leguminosarum bv. trifolii]
MDPHTIFELRRYRLLPAGREALISLFDREFVEPQEALGMRVEGEFRDLDDPDSFVWVRSFKDMQTRTEALASFYSGPIWKEHGPAANATMLNSDNVLLLKPAAGVLPFSHNLPRDREVSRSEVPGLAILNICSLAPQAEEDFARFFRDNALPAMQAAGARIDGLFITERSENGFPRLPVRQGETVFVWFEYHEDQNSAAGYQNRLRQNPIWTDEIYPQMDGRCWRRIEVARLTPTSRSLCAW